MHNIKGHDMKASLGDTFMNYAEAFKKTKTAETKTKKKPFSQIQNADKKKLLDPIIFPCLFILMENFLEIFSY
jgi:hypothetical protein